MSVKGRHWRRFSKKAKKRIRGVLPMAVAVSAERKAAARALMQFEPPTPERVAKVMDVHIRTLHTWMAEEEWRVPDFRSRDIREIFGRLRHTLRSRFVTVGAETPDAADGRADEPAWHLSELEALAGGAFAGAGLGGALPVPVLPETDEDPADRATRIAALLMRHGDLLLAQADAQGGTLTRAQIDTVSVMMRLADKLEPLAQERAAEQQKRSDDEIAEVLDRMDQRVVELAQAYAKELAAQKFSG